MSKNILIQVRRRLCQEASRGSVLQSSRSKKITPLSSDTCLSFSVACFILHILPSERSIWLSKLVNDRKVYLKLSVKLHFYEHRMKKALTRELKREWNVLKFSHSKDRSEQFWWISFSVYHILLWIFCLWNNLTI